MLGKYQCQLSRRILPSLLLTIHGQAILIANNALIVHEFATGYVLEDSSKSWDDRMRILINVTSCGTLINQAWTKTAFGATLLRISNRWQKAVIWFCIVSMNVWMIAKVIFQWAKLCGRDDYQQSYRIDFCITSKFRDDFKEGGNGKRTPTRFKSSSTY